MSNFDKKLEEVDKEVLEALNIMNFDNFMSRIDEFIGKYTKLLRFEEVKFK
jgi:hypothetical protein